MALGRWVEYHGAAMADALRGFRGHSDVSRIAGCVDLPDDLPDGRCDRGTILLNVLRDLAPIGIETPPACEAMLTPICVPIGSTRHAVSTILAIWRSLIGRTGRRSKDCATQQSGSDGKTDRFEHDVKTPCRKP